MLATFDFIPVNFIEFLIKFFNRSTINIPFICIYVTSFLFSSIIGDKKKTQIGKWLLISLLKIVVLKLVSTKQFVMIWSIAVAAFLVTLVGLFIIGIILFWYNKFRKFCTFLQLSWPNTSRLKSPTIWNFLNMNALSIPLVAYIKHWLTCFDFFCRRVLLK